MRQVGMQLSVRWHPQISGGNACSGRDDCPDRHTTQGVESILQDPFLARKKEAAQTDQHSRLAIGLLCRSRCALPHRAGKAND